MWLVAAAEPTSQGDSNAIILGVVAGLTAILVAAVTGIFALLTAKANRTSPAPPPPTTGQTGGTDLAFRDYVVGELAVNRKRDDDADERDEIQDRRLDQIERHLDLENPEWRHDGR